VVSQPLSNLYELNAFLVSWIMDLGVERVRKCFMRFRFHWDVIRHLQQQYCNGELGRAMTEELQRVIKETIDEATGTRVHRSYHYYQIELDTTHQNRFHVERLFVQVKPNRTTQVVIYENGETATMLSSMPAVGTSLAFTPVLVNAKNVTPPYINAPCAHCLIVSASACAGLLQTTTFTDALGYYTYHERISIHAMGAQLWLDQDDRPIVGEQIYVSEPNTQLDCSVPHRRSYHPIDVNSSVVTAESAAVAASANADFARQMKVYERKWYGRQDDAFPVASITMRVKRKFEDGIKLLVDNVCYLPDETMMSSSSSSSTDYSLLDTFSTAAATAAAVDTAAVVQPTTKRCRLASDATTSTLFSSPPASLGGNIPSFPPPFASPVGAGVASSFPLMITTSSLPTAAAMSSTAHVSSSAHTSSHDPGLLAGTTLASDASMVEPSIAFTHEGIEYVPLIASVLKHLFKDDTLPENIHERIKNQIQGRKSHAKHYDTLPNVATEHAHKHFSRLIGKNIVSNTKYYQLQAVRAAFENWRAKGRGH
jgi:hypothetical protein